MAATSIRSRESRSGLNPWLRRAGVLTAMVLLVGLSAPRAGADPPGPADPGGGVRGAWLERAGGHVEQTEYEVSWQSRTVLDDVEAAWQAPNRAQGLRTYFTETGIRVVPRSEDQPSWELGLSLVGYGRRGAPRPVDGASLVPDGQRIEYRRGDIDEWYVNDSRGLEQGFTLAAPPEETRPRGDPGTAVVPGARRDAVGDGEAGDPVFVALTLAGTLVPHLSADGRAVDFASPDGGLNILHFSHLEIRDATDRDLAAWFELFAGTGGPGVRLVFDDTDAVYPITVDPMLTTTAWTAEGDQVGAGFGHSVASAGDVNGDGYDDVIVGAPYFDGGQMDEGRASVYFGSASGLSTAPGWIMEPNAAGVLFGHSVSTAGDVNGDGYDDVIVGTPHYGLERFHEGAAWVYHGSPTGPATTPDWYAEGEIAGALFGYSVANAGDVNNDGYDDVLVGAPEFSGEEVGEGASYVFHGSAAGLETAESWMQVGGQAGAQFGYSVSTAGDVNGDGHDDVIVGAPRYDAGQTNEGLAFVYHGSSSGLSTIPDWTMESDQDDARFGHSVSTAGNVNGDGYDDVIVGAPWYDDNQNNQGAAWVYHGSPAGLEPSHAFYDESLLSSMNSGLGSSVASAGDVNGDGYDDIVVGTPLFDESIGGTVDAGRAYVILGSGDGVDIDRRWGSWSTQSQAQVGGSVAGAGDVNGDGSDDVIIGAAYYDNGQSDEGFAFVFHGSRQVVTAYDLVRSLGLADVEIYEAPSFWTTLGVVGQPPADGSSDSVSYGPIPESILITSGRAEDGGLGSTDWGNDGDPDHTRLTIALAPPIGAQVLRFTTQFITSEYDAGNPGRDHVSLSYEYIDVSAETDLDISIGALTTGAVNPPMSHAVSVQDKEGIRIRIYVDDEVDGFNDSALLLSNVFFSEVPLPADIEGPDIDGDGVVDYYHEAEPHDVSLRAGTYTFAKPLLEVPGKRMPFNLSVLYNSGSSLTGAVGRRWSHSYESYAYKLLDDNGSGYPDNILIRHGTSLAEYFEESEVHGEYLPKFGGSHSALTLNLDGTVEFITKDHLTYEFTESGNDDDTLYFLKKVTDPNGNFFTIQYDEYHRIDRVVDTRNETFKFHFGNDGLLDRVEYAAAGVDVRFGYDQANNLSWFRDPEGNRTDFTYDASGNLLTGTDAEGVVFVSNTYQSHQGLGIDQTGSIVVSQRDGRDPNPWDDAAGVSIASDGDSMTTTDRLGREEIRLYDVKGRLTKRVDRMGVEWSYTYDADNNTTSETNPQDVVTAMEYDDYGNRTSRTEADGVCVGGANQGSPCAVATEDVDCPDSSCGSRTTMTYDSRHNLETSSDHYGNTTTYTYDPANDNQLSEADPLGNTVSYTYNGDGQKETETTRRGNDPGDPVFDVASYTYTYDALGYLESETDPLNHVTQYTWDTMGRKIAETNPRNASYVTSYEYDHNGRLTGETNPLDQTTRYSYDRVGRLIATQEHNGATTGFDYTPTGKLERLTDPLGHSVDFAYDDEDRLVRPTGPLGRFRLYDYDDEDRLTHVTDRGGGTASATYDEIGKRTSIADPNDHVLSYEYDLLGRETREIDPRCNSEPPDPRCASGLLSIHTTYDGRGVVTSLTNQRGQRIDYDYDAAGRLTNVALQLGDTITHTLDAEGNRTSSVSTRFANVSRQFDALERLISRSDGFGNTVGYQYDAAGNVEVLTYSDGKTVTYFYDELNRLERVEDWNVPPKVTTYAYDEVGNLIETTLPDGSTIAYTYDAAHQLVGISDTGPSGTVFAAGYTYNAAGERTSAELTLPLDPIIDLDDQSFIHNESNEIVTRGTDAYVYDEDGNMTSGVFGGGTRSMSYDELHQLVQIDSDTFEYDVDGLRVRATRGGVTRRFVYDPTGERLRLLEEHDDAGNIVARYVYGFGLISREDNAGNLGVYHFDSRGSTIALTNTDGAITDRYAYAPYGQVVRRAGETTENPFTFNGRDGVVDDGNGLYFMRVRYYSPALMRFVQKDQSFEGFLHVTQSLNRHVYVMGNPIQFVDPNGDVNWEQVAWLSLGVMALIAAAVVASSLGVLFVVGVLIVVGAVAVVWAVMYFVFGVEIDWMKLTYLTPLGWIKNFVNDVFGYDIVSEFVAPGVQAYFYNWNLIPGGWLFDLEITPSDIVDTAIGWWDTVSGLF